MATEDVTTQTSAPTEDEVADLLYASRAGEADEMEALLADLAPSNAPLDALFAAVQKANEAHNSPLHYAAANGHHHLVAPLLSRVQLSTLLAQNDSGNTPLHWAAFNGHLEVVKALIERIEALAPTPSEEEQARVAALDEEQRDAEAEKQARQRSIWDVVNKAGRGPMSEAQMNNKEAVVDYMLQRMVTAPTGAPSEETVPDQDTQTEKSAPESTTLADQTQGFHLNN